MNTTLSNPRRRAYLHDLTMAAGIILCVAGAAALVHQCAYRIVLERVRPNTWSADDGLNALIDAATEGQTDRVAALLARGVDVNGRGYTEFTPLMRAAVNGRADTCRRLIDRGADVEASTYHGWNALMLAAAASHEPVVRLLLARGAAVDAPVRGGRTALMTACAGADDRIAAILIEAGADVNAVSDSGVTPLIDAAGASASADVTALIRRLVAHGARVNVADCSGSTPLIEASRWGAPETVAILLQAGADTSIRDGDGRDAASYAARDPARAAVAALLIDAAGQAGLAARVDPNR